MLRLPLHVRVFAATRPVSFTNGADGLMNRVRGELGADPLTGDVYCFFNRRRNAMAMLVWDRNGFWVMSKRLERGRFELLDRRTPWIELEREELVMLLAGIDTKTWRFRARFSRDVRIAPRGEDEPARAAQ